MTITGTATKSFAPDLIAVSLEHSKTFETYEGALKDASSRTGQIRALAIEAGLNGDDLKTNGFSVDAAYETYKDSDHNYLKRFVGYKNYVAFEIAFAFDNKVLSRLLGKLTGTEDKIGFSYRLSNPEKAKEEVMGLATKSAIRKANLIAEAASIGLGDIINIDYSVKEINLRYQSHMMLDCCPTNGNEGPEIDITPRDLTFTDSVTVIFGIK